MDESTVLGGILGAACGDALGRPFEGREVVDADALRRWLAGLPAELVWTDDTALMLTLAEHLGRCGGTVAQDELAVELAQEWERAPWRGYGGGAKGLFERVRGGAPWREEAAGLFNGEGSLANGAAMRVAPVGLLGLGLGETAELARQSARVTHTHPLGVDGSVVQALAVRLAASREAVDPVGFCETIAGFVETRGFGRALGAVAGLASRAATAEEVVAAVGNDVTALRSVPAALTAFLRHPDSPPDAIRFAIELGGDADTIASMAGAAAGARGGRESLPGNWIDRLEDLPRLLAAGDGLRAQ